MTMIAIGLAVIDSFCFAAAAVYQQRAVRRTLWRAQDSGARTDDHRLVLTQQGERADTEWRSHLGVRSLPSLMRRRGWMLGLALMAGGAGLHAVALALAPVSVVQPIGLLGVPFAVLLAARSSGRMPHRGAVIPILICLISTASFVALASHSVHSQTVTSVGDMLVAEAAVIIVITAVGIIGRRLHGWVRSLLYAVGGAIGVGMVSVLMRGVTQLFDSHPDHTVAARMVIMCALLIGNGLVGAWMIHQAYASGAPEVVLACLTVVDPMIAVLAGLVLLGEGTDLGSGALLGMVALGSVAMLGVCLLARFHPDVTRRSPDRGWAPDLSATGAPRRLPERHLHNVSD